MAEGLLKFLTCGSVDDGKSTLIGRLLHDAGAISTDQLQEVAAASARSGSSTASFDPALVTDGLKAEREQGITIDVAYRYFSTPKRAFIIADTPGHEQYTRNMVTGASGCELAVILVDARRGIQVQTRRHAAIAALLGIRHLILAVNKMDLVDYRQTVFDAVADAFREVAARVAVADVQCVPIAALAGDNVVTRSLQMPWYEGHTVLHALETVQTVSSRNVIDFRLPVQRVSRLDEGRRSYQGTVASGALRSGANVVILPSGEPATITALARAGAAVAEAVAGDPVSVELNRQLDVSRGDVIVHERNRPRVGRRLEAMLVWMGADPLQVGHRYLLKHLTRTTGAAVRSVAYRFNPGDFHRTPAETLSQNDIGRVEIMVDAPVCWDPFDRNRVTGAVILIDRITCDTVAGGMLIDRLPETGSSAFANASADRRSLGGGWSDRAHQPGPVHHGGMTIWLTGLSGAGKSAIAKRVAAQLQSHDRRVVVLDGDRIRTGLNRDLGFSPADRSENVRRIAEVAKLFTDEGFVVLVPVISPFRADRRLAREIIGAGRFREVWVNAPLEVCEARDVKGLYQKARAGQIPEFTGISSPYETPLNPELVVGTVHESVEESAAAVMDLLNPEP